jgi:hypothetical protein
MVMRAAVRGVSDPGGTPAPPGIRNHRRFAMTDVTFEDRPVGGATVDVWQDATGAQCWSVRVVMPSREMPPAGTLGGRTRDGRLLRGPVTFVGPGPALKGRGPVLMEWRGVGPLLAVEVPDER